MRCAAALSTHPIPSHATGDVIADLLQRDARPPELLMVFITPAFVGAAEDIRAAIQTVLSPSQLVLAVSSGVIASGSEVTRGAAIGIWACWTDRNESISMVHFSEDARGAFRPSQAISAESLVVLLVTPSFGDISGLLEQTGALFPEVTFCGGLLSEVAGPVQLLDSSGMSRSLLAITFSNTASAHRVGFGSESVSERFNATRVIGSMLCAIDGQPALQMAHSVLAGLDRSRQSKVAEDLAVGIIDPQSGDLREVIRVLGADSAAGALALAGPVQEDSLFEFHSQDRRSAESGIGVALGGTRSHGALLFSTEPINSASLNDGVGELGRVSEELGCSEFAGIHVASAIGAAVGRSRLLAAPLAAAIFGRAHH
jgi:small ligand-binding sensory domain FIST